MSQDSVSLNKFISATGRCSRREADRMIAEGRVALNGKMAMKGNRVSAGDKVMIDGKPLKNKPNTAQTYIALHKPAGITCTTDKRDKDNIIDFVRHRRRIFPIGRLDKASTGLILLTSDGDIVNRILRKEGKHEKEYIVSVDKPITDAFIKKMSGGVPILGTMTDRCKVTQLGRETFKIILTQGLNRQIRRMCEHLHYRVMKLKRTRIMNIKLSGIQVGQWRDLTAEELDNLRKQL